MTKKCAVVALVGRPNSGKSTLLNKILGEDISIVTPKAQTTREQVRGIYNDERGQIIFVDTPGIHNAKPGGLNENMMESVVEALKDPDAIVYLIDPSSKPEFEETVLKYLNTTHRPIFPVMTKVDLPYADPNVWLSQFIAQWQEAKSNIQGLNLISARKNLQVQELLSQIFQIAPEGPALFSDTDQLTDRSVRFLSGELIRKQLFLCLGDEVPYSTAVEIDSFKENENPIHIEATVFVERDSQKGMVIGQGGKKIKEIGTKAREEIQNLLQQKVFLGLRVKVAPDWTQKKDFRV